MAQNKFKKSSPPTGATSPSAPAVAGTKEQKKTFNRSIKAEKRYTPKVVMKG